jgi:hypothetical protein
VIEHTAESATIRLFRAEDLADSDQVEPGYIQRGLVHTSAQALGQGRCPSPVTARFRAATKSREMR